MLNLLQQNPDRSFSDIVAGGAFRATSGDVTGAMRREDAVDGEFADFDL